MRAYLEREIGRDRCRYGDGSYRQAGRLPGEGIDGSDRAVGTAPAQTVLRREKARLIALEYSSSGEVSRAAGDCALRLLRTDLNANDRVSASSAGQEQS